MDCSPRKEKRITDWSNKFNQDIVEEIASRIDSHADYTRFRIACKTWTSFLPRFTKNRLPCELPSLMTFNSGHFEFYSLFAGEHGTRYKLQVPSVEKKVCRGSSKGWLIMLVEDMLVEDSNSIHLVNPLKPDTWLQLPPMYASPYIHKVVLSCCPDQKNCLAMVIYGLKHKVACCRLGDKGWRSVNQPKGGSTGWRSRIEDIVHHDGKFFMVDYRGGVFFLSDEQILNNCSFPQPQLVYAQQLYTVPDKGQLYLAVGSLGELLMINRRIWCDGQGYTTSNFDIYKLIMNNLKWSKVESLGDDVLFLGVNESFSLSYRSISHSSCKGDCIYFTSRYLNGRKDKPRSSDVGAFDLKSCSVMSIALPVSGYNRRTTRIWTPPLWIKPSAI